MPDRVDSAGTAAASGPTVVRPGATSLLPQYARIFLPVPLPGGGQGGVDGVLRHTGIRPDPGHVARYARLVGEEPSAFLPLLYPHLLGFDLQLTLMSDRRFPLRPIGLVHVFNEVVTTRRIPRDAVLDVAVNVTAPRPHPKGRAVDMLTTVAQDGVAVWSETSTYLARGTGTEDAPSPGVDLDEAGLHPSASWRLGADLGRRYGTLTGDVNPIHLYPLTAKAFGFRRHIVHGMWTTAAVAGALVNRLPEAVRYSVQFRRPLTLPCTAWLDTSVDGGPDGGVARARVRRGDDVALTAIARPA